MEEFKRLYELKEGEKTQLMTIRAKEVYLIKEEKKVTCQVFLGDNPEIMTNSKERKKHFKDAEQREYKKWLEEKLEKFQDPEIAEIRIATPEHPMEIITGDVCLILEIEGKEYILWFWRDIYPYQWLFPGGCPEDLEEIFNPKKVAKRELCEEVIIGDIDGNFYSICVSETTLAENIHDWKIEPQEIIPAERKELSFNEGEAQKLIIRRGDRKEETENIVISLDREHASASLVLYRKVTLPMKLSELRLFDGEKLGDGTLIKRLVRLTTSEGKVAAIFHQGEDVRPIDRCLERTKKLARIY